MSTTIPHCGRCRTPVQPGAVACPNCGARFVARAPLRKTIIMFGLLGAVAASFWSQSRNPSPGDAQGNASGQAAITQAQEAVQAALAPEAVQFRGLAYREREASAAVCGEAGGTGGYQRFVWPGPDSAPLIERQLADFQAHWDRYC